MKHYSWVAERNQSVPSVHITTNKSRRVRYSKESTKPTYYLKDGEEFQLEIHNPTSDIIKAEIWLNDKLTSTAGLVLKPGERVFLDRYLDSPQKFLFETYKVSGTAANKKAIESNGNVEVRFYREVTITNWKNYWPADSGDIHYYTPETPYYHTGTQTPGLFTYATGTAADINLDNNSLTIASGMTTTSTVNSMGVNAYTSTISNDVVGSASQLLCDSSQPHKKKNIETGRVGKGSNSNQTFDLVHYEFEYMPFYMVQYNILPESNRPITTRDIKTTRYCTNCGTKIKQTHKFCSNCGTKI